MHRRDSCLIPGGGSAVESHEGYCVHASKGQGNAGMPCSGGRVADITAVGSASGNSP